MSPARRKTRKPSASIEGAMRRGQVHAPEPAAGEKDASRKGEGTRARPEPVHPRLERLYEISKLLLQFENVEQLVSSVLAILTRALPLRTAILIMEVGGIPRTIVWKAQDMGADALGAAKAHARIAYGYLVGADAAESLSLETVQAQTSEFFRGAAKGPDSETPDQKRFILLPLVIGHRPIFGALQLEAALPLNEPDLTLVNAVINQLSIALDRYHAWRNDVALRERAEALYGQIAESERRKDEFLAMLGHELRNPLAPISTALEVLRLRGVKDESQKRAIEVLERQLRHMTRLVDDLLDVSRITRGTISLQTEVLDLATVVNQTVESVRPLVESHGHELSVELPRERVSLKADPVRLAQMITNLLQNAAKYTVPGGHIWLAAKLAGDELVLSVRDTGIGIAPEMLREVFGLFTQVAPSLARSEGGLGIGLTLARRLAEMHGGTVEARSAGLGHGSEFVLRLPAMPGASGARALKSEAARVPGLREAQVLESEAAPVSGPGEAQVPQSEPAPVPGPGMRVLVVDDNVDSVAGMAEVLGLWGYEVQVAYDGPTAIKTTLDFRPRVVLLDIGLPEMDGYEVAARLRQEKVLSGVVLVALTGYGQESARQSAREAGFDLHFTKPVDIAALRQFLAAQASGAE